jgi:hypothetical protein
VKWPAPPSATRCRITSNALTLDVFGQLVPGDRSATGTCGAVTRPSFASHVTILTQPTDMPCKESIHLLLDWPAHRWNGNDGDFTANYVDTELGMR